MEPGERNKTSSPSRNGRSHPELLFRALPPTFKLSADARRTLKNFAGELADQAVDGRSFTCLITNDRELQKLNRSFLGHDYPTDVLSFPGADGELGEIAISVERAAAQAKAHGHSCLEEICVLMLHGVLHLSGFDHERDEGRMARAERKWQSAFGLPATLIERSALPEVKS
jgi:probable rRNA maturation factor